MSDSAIRRPLALTATIATSVAAAAGLLAPAANATTPSPGGTATLTFSGGTSTTPAKAAAVTGTKYGLGFAPQTRDLAWAPTGARAAWVDPVSGAVIAGVPGGAAQVIAPGAARGTVRSHPTWIDGGSKVVWSEKAPGTNPATGKPYDAVLNWAYGNGIQGAGGPPTVQTLQALAGSDLLHPDSVGSLLVYQVNTPGKAAQIYLWDRAQAASAPVLVATGWDPSISADGTHVAFVATTPSAGNNIYTVALNNLAAAPNQVTAGGVGGFENPVWTPDGTGLVFQVLDAGMKDSDAMSVPAAAAKTTAYTEVVPGTKVVGLPAFEPTVRAHVERIAGGDRLDTAVKASQSHWATAGAKNSQGAAAKAVVLSRSDQFADALGGSALAAKVGGPLLLTPTAALSPAVKAEIQRVLGPGDGAKTVYVLGGEKALSPSVATALAALRYKVVRVAGGDRFSTAVAIADTITGSPNVAPDYILVATGENFPDALSAGAAAGAINAHQGKNAVVLLTDDKVMPQPTIQYLAPLLGRTNLNPDPQHSRPANFIELDSIGGAANTALSSRWIPAGAQGGSFLGLWGLDRYETSYFVARYFFGAADAVGLATGMNWADALSGGAEMGTENGPLLLVDPKAGVVPEVAQWTRQDNGQYNRAEIFGGTVAVPGSVDKVVGGLIAGTGGVDYPSNPRV